jgi:hypothetical protein
VLEHDRPEPPSERLRHAQRSELAVRVDERLLSDILREMVVPEDRRRVGHDSILVRAHQLREGEIVARLRTCHQPRGPLPLNHLSVDTV